MRVCSVQAVRDALCALSVWVAGSRCSTQKVQFSQFLTKVEFSQGLGISRVRLQ